MDFYEKLYDICESYNCCLERVGDEAPAEYVGWENSILIFSSDAKQGEHELIILKDTGDPKSILREFSKEEGLTASHRNVLNELSQWMQTMN